MAQTVDEAKCCHETGENGVSGIDKRFLCLRCNLLVISDLMAKNGASERIRTVDNHVGNVMLYQLSYTRILSSINENEPYFT